MLQPDGSLDVKKRSSAATQFLQQMKGINTVHFGLMMDDHDPESRKIMFAMIFKSILNTVPSNLLYLFRGLPDVSKMTMEGIIKEKYRIIREPDVLGQFIQEVIEQSDKIRLKNFETSTVNSNKAFPKDVPENILIMTSRNDRICAFTKHFMQHGLNLEAGTVEFERLGTFIPQIQVNREIKEDFKALANLLIEANEISVSYRFPSKVTPDHQTIKDRNTEVDKFLGANSKHRHIALYMKHTSDNIPLKIAIFTDPSFIVHSIGNLLEVMGVSKEQLHFADGAKFLSDMQLERVENPDENYSNCYLWVQSVSYIADVFKSEQGKHIVSMFPLHSAEILADFIKRVVSKYLEHKSKHTLKHIPGHYSKIAGIDFAAQEFAGKFYTDFITQNFNVKDVATKVMDSFIQFFIRQSTREVEEFQGLARFVLNAETILHLDISHFKKFLKLKNTATNNSDVFAQFLEGVVYENDENMRIAFFIRHTITSASIPTAIFTSLHMYTRCRTALEYFLVTMRGIVRDTLNFGTAVAFLMGIVYSYKPIVVEQADKVDKVGGLGHHEFLSASAFRMSDILKSRKNRDGKIKAVTMPLHHVDTLTEIVNKVRAPSEPFRLPACYDVRYIGIDIISLYTKHKDQPGGLANAFYKAFLENDLDSLSGEGKDEKLKVAGQLVTFLEQLDSSKDVVHTLLGADVILNEYVTPSYKNHKQTVEKVKRLQHPVDMKDVNTVTILFQIVLIEGTVEQRTANLLHFGDSFHHLTRDVLFGLSERTRCGAFIDLYYAKINTETGKSSDDRKRARINILNNVDRKIMKFENFAKTLILK